MSDAVHYKNIVRICFISILVYALLATLAILSQRHLFMDASWYLVKILDTGSFTKFWTDFWKEFYYTRAFATWITEIPLVATISLFSVSVTTASMMYGVGLYGLKVISTLLTFAFLRKENRYLMIFPLFSLWAGTASSDLVIVSEAHVAATLAWPVLFAATGALKQTNMVRSFVIFCCIVLLLAYESMAIFGAITASVVILRDLVYREVSRRGYLRSIAVLTAASSILAWTAILWPRDAANRIGIASGLFSAALDSSSLATSHPGPTLAILACITSLIVCAWLRHRVWWLAFIAIILGSATALVPAAIVYYSEAAFRPELAYTDRALSLFLIPSAVMALYTASHFFPTRSRALTVALALTLPCTVVGQSITQLYETAAWRGSYGAVRHAIAEREGVSSCIRALPHALNFTSADPRKMVCGWSISALSILASRSPTYKAVLVGDSSFQPFDPFVATEYPRLTHIFPTVVPDEAAFEDSRALIIGKPIAFNFGGDGWRYIVSGTSFAEAHGTWSDAEKVVMRVCAPHNGRVPTQLSILVAPFLAKSVPMQHVILNWRGSPLSESVLANWDPDAPSVLRIKPLGLSSGSCGDLIIKLPDARSPKNAGVGDDPRLLGITLLSMEAS